MSDLASSIVSLWTNIIEPPFILLNLQNPVKRFAVVSVGAATAIWLTEPRAMFHDGSPRPNCIFSDSTICTPFDWVFVSLFAGALTVVFV